MIISAFKSFVIRVTIFCEYCVREREKEKEIDIDIFLVVFTALICTQCYSMTVKEHEKMETWFLEMIPNLHDPQCGEAYHSMASSTPAPKIISNQQPVLPTTCEISAVAGTNTEIRCGFYKGYIETRAHNGIGKLKISYL